MSGSQNTLLETIRQVVRQEMQRSHGSTLGVVQEEHSSGGEYACTVKLHDSDIVLKKVPVATTRMGMASIPAVDELVLVQFLGGDINRPVIVGSLYNDEDQAPEHGSAQAICQIPLGGGGVALKASGGDTPSLEIEIGSALLVTLQDDDPVVSIDVGSGSAALKIDSDGTVSITGGMGFTIEAGTDLVLKGSNVEIEGSGQVTIKGAVVNIN
ncbi:MAG: Rhs element Vgr protein [Gammaproteobacteria bacterium]|nr:Rhs element Vgr protein [Gammaproteobacteria bacterium]MCP4386915.1 Rhs element Vgr protein [Gammaproteobacteria bacterium]